MQAYNKTDLHNKYIQEQASDAFEHGYINEESFKKILLAHPFKLYTPNYFIRIALGLLTIVAVICTALLAGLITGAFDTDSLVIFFIFLAAICYVALEFFIKVKHFYNTGVDNILMISVPVFVISGVFSFDLDSSYLFVSLVMLIVCLWLSLRFTDSFMAGLSFCAFFAFILFLYIRPGNFAKAWAPFVMMAVSAIIYFIVTQKLNSGKRSVYQFSLETVRLLTLIAFYASGNSFVIDMSNEIFMLTGNRSFSISWLFWIFTLTIPLLYIVYGVIKKDFLLMRTGLALIAATVFTVRFYFEILPVEIVMLIAGIMLIGVSYVLIKYLKQPRYGYTSDNLYPSKKNALNIEALIIAETFSKQQSTTQDTSLYGGGSGGGGGATGEY